MRRNPKSRTLTAAELVDAVAAVSPGRRWSGLTLTERQQIDQLLADDGLDHIDLARAQARVKLARAQRRARGDDV